MTYLVRVFRPALLWWALYFGLVIAASAVQDVTLGAKALLILSGVALAAAVRRLTW